MEVVDNEGRMVPKKCRVEQLNPNLEWQKSFYFSGLRGLSTEIRSFCFKLLHQLLLFNELLHKLQPNNPAACSLCPANAPESPLHAFFLCELNCQASQDLILLVRHYDSSLTAEKALCFDIHFTESIYELQTMLMLATGMHLIWKNR